TGSGGTRASRGQRASASPMRMPGWMPKPSAAAETSPTSCSRPDSGAKAAGPCSRASRAPTATTSSKRGSRTQTTGIEHMFALAAGRHKRVLRNVGNPPPKDRLHARWHPSHAHVASAHTTRGKHMSRPSISKRALLAMLAALAVALSAGVVATAKQSNDHSPGFTNQLASARLATAKYATDLDQAKADGYRIITRD